MALMQSSMNYLVVGQSRPLTHPQEKQT